MGKLFIFKLRADFSQKNMYSSIHIPVRISTLACNCVFFSYTFLLPSGRLLFLNLLNGHGSYSWMISTNSPKIRLLILTKNFNSILKDYQSVKINSPELSSFLLFFSDLWTMIRNKCESNDHREQIIWPHLMTGFLWFIVKSHFLSIFTKTAIIHPLSYSNVTFLTG